MPWVIINSFFGVALNIKLPARACPSRRKYSNVLRYKVKPHENLPPSVVTSNMIFPLGVIGPKELLIIDPRIKTPQLGIVVVRNQLEHCLKTARSWELVCLISWEETKLFLEKLENAS